MRRLAILAGLMFVTACGAPAPSPQQVAARAATLLPTDARLASLYAQSCQACHARTDTGAPLTGDLAAWKPRVAKGLPALVQSAVSGVGGMPPGGQCFACTAADYEALIRFMSTGKDRE